MKNQIKIISITTDRWKEYGNLLQRSYREFPESFLISYEDEISLPDLERRYKQFIEDPNAIAIFSEIDNQLIGAVVAYFPPDKVNEHISDIIYFFVIPEFQGKGAAAM